jgi:uncharacterized protein YbaP (TraB family)
MEGITKVSYGTYTIQKSRRIDLDPNLPTTLRLQEGDTVSIELDVGSATILIREDDVVAPPKKKWKEPQAYAIERRNAIWLPRILEMCQTRARTLIAVGALHLPGAVGLLSGLRLAELSLRQIVV